MCILLIWYGLFWPTLEAITASKQPLRPNPTSDLKSNYPLIYMHIAYMTWALLAASTATTASKQPWRSNLTSDLKSVTQITYFSRCILLLLYESFWQPEATTASKQPWRSNLTSYLKSVILITYLSMCILLIWNEPFGSLWGYCSLQTASEVKSDLRVRLDSSQVGKRSP